jgi:hypothetical protein
MREDRVLLLNTFDLLLPNRQESDLKNLHPFIAGISGTLPGSDGC